ncbi:SH3 domain-containing protein [Tenacibaculum ovolyticum]|uniref:SH3 domain-containing protein n=1 Tax=Tenacibaculum ovolyticum TaxID=104270 RepID=UPI00041EC4C2|nr:SH3 domain-containing protein [Tenacibaculum ovolyticum]
MSCKKNNKTEVVKQKTENKQFLKISDNKSFVISCGSGCAMTYSETGIVSNNNSKEVTFEVQMFIDEVLTDGYFETYVFNCDNSKEISLKGDNTFKLDKQVVSIQENLNLYTNRLCLKKEEIGTSQEAISNFINLKKVLNQVKNVNLPLNTKKADFLKGNIIEGILKKFEDFDRLSFYKIKTIKEGNLLLLKSSDLRGEDYYCLLTINNNYEIIDYLTIKQLEEFEDEKGFGVKHTMFEVSENYVITIKKSIHNKYIVDAREYIINSIGEFEQVKSEKELTVNNYDLKLRDSHNLLSNTLELLAKETSLDYIEKSNNQTSVILNGKEITDYWYKVKTPKGNIGWVHGSCIKNKE